jgi:hypothetical protein
VKRSALAAALLCTAAGLAWQWLSVRFNYGDNWTALFCHGAQHPLPASLAGEHIYVFPNSGGYDGQSYHYVAHDPLCRSDICRAVPDPGRRYPRILVPGLAYLLALGRSEWIDRAFVAVNLGFLFLGAYWLAQLCRRPMLAALYVVLPSSIVSLDKMLIDLALVSLCLGFAVYQREPRGREWKLWVILAAAALCREAGFLLWGAWALREAGARRWVRIALFATALIPAIAWNLYAGAGGFGLPIPLAGVMDAVLHPRTDPFSAAVNLVLRVLEWAQLAGLLLSMAFGVAGARRVWTDAIAGIGLLWAIFGLVTPAGTYDDPIAGVRILGPLLLFQWLSGERWRRLPLALAAPRAWAQLAGEAWGIVRGLV